MSNQVHDNYGQEDIELTKQQQMDDAKVMEAETRGGLMRSTTTKMSDNEAVRLDLIHQTRPMKLTKFFIEKPCIAIWTPYILLFIFAFIAGAGEMMTFELVDDSWLVNDDDKVINRDITNVAHWSLNREEAGIDKKQEKLDEDNVRYESNGLQSILVIYEDTAGGPTGLLKKSTLRKIIEIENAMISWSEKSDSFKNTKFNG